MKGIYTIYAYRVRSYQRRVFGIAIPSDKPTLIWDRLDITSIYVEGENEEEALTKAKLLIDRPYYDIVAVNEKLGSTSTQVIQKPVN